MSLKEKCDRNNFLKGSHILEVLLKKNRISYEPESFVELRGDDRKRKYDDIMKKLFQKLKWKFPFRK